MTDNDRRPTRVEEPSGFDRTPTERIPVAGDLPDGRDSSRPPADPSEVDGRRDPATEPMADATELPAPRHDLPVDGPGLPADGADRPGDARGDLPADRPDLPRDARDVPEDGRDVPEDGRDEVVGGPAAVTEELPAAPVAATGAGFFAEGAVDRFRDRWRELQAGFVDDPATAVRNADELIDEIMRELAERKQNLEGRWRGAPGDTEELRVAIQEYRSFFNQLLNA